MKVRMRYTTRRTLHGAAGGTANAVAATCGDGAQRAPSRRAVYVGIAVLIASALSSTLIAPRYVTDSSDVVFVGKWIFFPGIVAGVLLLKRWRRWPERRGYLYAVAFGFVAALLALKPATVINANMGTVVDATVEGRIVDIAPASRRLPARFIFVGEAGDRHRWPLPDEAVKTARVGDWLRIRYRVGGLGIHYVIRGERYWAVTHAR